MGWSSMDLFGVFFTSQLILREANHRLSKQGVRLGLSLLELQVLWIATVSNPMTMTEASMITGHSKTALKPAIESLEMDGLMLRIYSNDSRKFSLVVTEEGRALIRRIPTCERSGASCLQADPQEIRDFVQAACGLIVALRGHEVVDKLNHAITPQ